MVAQSILQSIHQDCDKPLQSKWYVEAKGKPKFDWYYYASPDYTVRSNKAGTMWFAYDRLKRDRMSETERAQWKLYRQLKREFENSSKSTTIDNTTLTLKEKTQAITRKKSIQLLNGLISSPRYDRIYGTI